MASCLNLRTVRSPVRLIVILLIILSFAFVILSLLSISTQPSFLEQSREAQVTPVSRREYSDLNSLCTNATVWRQGVWLKCHNHCEDGDGGYEAICGGLNNIRNRYSTCIRLAIDAGAGLILAPLTTRNPDDIRDVHGGRRVDADQYFDISHLRDAMGEMCPQLQIRHLHDAPPVTKIVVMPERHYSDPPFSTQPGKSFRNAIEPFLASKEYTIRPHKDENLAITFYDSFASWDYVGSGEIDSVQKDLFRAVRYAPSLLRLGDKTHSHPALSQGYIGVHLRGEHDWVPHFGSLDLQLKLFSGELEATEGRIRDVYVSSGDGDAIDVFRERVKPLGFRLHDKWSLLADKPNELRDLKALSFDEGAALEYEVLRQADVFLGLAMSTMSLMVAYAREVDGPNSFFKTYITPGSTRALKNESMHREYENPETMRGNNRTRLLIVSADCILHAFP